MLAVLLWIAKPVWQYCLPFSKLPFFFKKSAKKPLFLCTFSTTKKKTRQIVKRLFLAPKERSFILQSPHPGLFSCVFQSKTIQAESWRQNILQYILLFCSAEKKTRFAPVIKFQKNIYFLELFCLVCIVAWGQDSLSKKSSSEGCWIEFKVQKERKSPFYLNRNLILHL